MLRQWKIGDDFGKDLKGGACSVAGYVGENEG